MKHRVAVLCAIGFVTAALASGCAVFAALSPLPDRRTPADRARELQPRCRTFSAESASAAMAPSAIDSVETAYSYSHSGPGDRQARMRGARIHIRPLAGLSRESLQRNLECHEVSVTLGSVQASESDPYSLPDRWLDIDVDSEGDAFVVSVTIDSLEDAHRVLERAQKFAANSTSFR